MRIRWLPDKGMSLMIEVDEVTYGIGYVHWVQFDENYRCIQQQLDAVLMGYAEGVL